MCTSCGRSARAAASSSMSAGASTKVAARTANRPMPVNPSATFAGARCPRSPQPRATRPATLNGRRGPGQTRVVSFARRALTPANSPMLPPMLAAVTCPNCGHVGALNAAALPRPGLLGLRSPRRRARRHPGQVADRRPRRAGRRARRPGAARGAVGGTISVKRSTRAPG